MLSGVYSSLMSQSPPVLTASTLAELSVPNACFTLQGQGEHSARLPVGRRTQRERRTDIALREIL